MVALPAVIHSQVLPLACGRSAGLRLLAGSVLINGVRFQLINGVRSQLSALLDLKKKAIQGAFFVHD